MHGAIEYDDSTLRQRNHAANDKTSSQLASHTIFTFLAGFVKRAIAELFRTFQGNIGLKDLQCIAVCEVEVSSVIQNKDHSPAEWPGCRVTDSHPPTNAAHGRPRLAYREHHWIAPMRLTAAQSGPWLRPVNLQPLSGQNNTDQATPDIRPTQEDHEKKSTPRLDNHCNSGGFTRR